MKTIKLTICLFTLGCFLISCQDSIELEEILNDQEVVSTRSANQSNGWDNCVSTILKSGREVKLPWIDGSGTAVPDHIRKNNKIEDGWTILDATVQIVGATHPYTDSDPGVNYLILYNIHSGVLKGYYYAETMVGNNCGCWQLSTSAPTKLFNFSPYFSEPQNGECPQSIIVSTSTNGEPGGFELGWNCFVQELSYDETSYLQKLNISAFAMNKATITHQGTYNSSSSGTILSSTGKKSETIDALATEGGTQAKKWMSENVGDSNSSKVIKFAGSVASIFAQTGASGLISSGLYKVFGSLLGSSQTEYDLSFKTNGSLTIKGEMESMASGMIRPVAGLKLGNPGMNLGIWNLVQSPSYKTKGDGDLVKSYSQSQFDYRFTRKIDDVVLTINPNIKGTTTRTSVALIYQRYNKALIPIRSNSSSGNGQITKTQSETLHYMDSVTTITSCNNTNILATRIYPDGKNGNNKPSIRYQSSGLSIFERVAINVLLTHKVQINGETRSYYSSKVFIPNQSVYDNSSRPYTWSRDELNALGFY